MLKINKSQLKNISLFLFLAAFFFLNANKQDDVNFSSKQNSVLFSDYITDEIKPFCQGVNFKNSKQMKLTNLERININFINKSSWYENLISAHKNDQDIIYEKYKRRFMAQIVFIFSDGSKCEADAKIRISGDWKDHIDLTSLSSSMDVSLNESNVDNITKFKLFLPESKRSDTEFVTTQIMRKLKFLVPKTFSVNVSINNQPNKPFIFQEKIVKEFLESNHLREGPLVETSEEMFWENRKRDLESPVLFSKILNKNWATRSKSNTILSTNAIENYNKLIFQSPVDYLHYQNHLGQFEELRNFDTAMYALDGHHGLAVHNRKFYFNKLENKFTPIYYDADSQIANRDLFFGACDINNKQSEYEVYRCVNNFNLGASDLLNKINFDYEDIYIDLQNQNVFVEKKLVKDIFERFKFNLYQLSNIDNYALEVDKNHISTNNIQKTESSLNKDFGFYFYNLENKKYTICNLYISDCKDIDLEILFDFTSVNFENKEYFFIGSSFESLKSTTPVIDSLQISDGVFMKIFGDNNYSVIIKKRSIDLVLNNNQKVFFYGDGSFENFEINIQNNQFTQKQIERQDENLLTGCLTIYKLHLDNLRIFSENSNCEDSVNLINVSGNLNNLEIKNSTNDGLDIDFSNLQIENLQISDSGNDCLDVSYSNLLIAASDLKNCSDKAVSIGENSNVQFNELNTVLSGIGIAIKDSSEVQIEKFSSSQNNICVAMYRKKQEFGPSYLLVKDYKCYSEIENFIQKGQEFVRNEN